MDGPGVHLKEDLCRLQRPPAAPQVQGVPGEARPSHGGIKTEQSITIDHYHYHSTLHLMAARMILLICFSV